MSFYTLSVKYLPENIDVMPLAMAMLTASRWQSLWNSLYEDKVITHPQAGPRENMICFAASFHISNVRRRFHLGVTYSKIPITAPGSVKLLIAKIIRMI